MITRTIENSFTPTTLEMAREFWLMDADAQAMFFNMLGMESTHDFSLQMQAVTDSKILNNDGRAIMEIIGNYAHEASLK